MRTKLTTWKTGERRKGVQDEFEKVRKVVLHFNARLDNNPDAINTGKPIITLASITQAKMRMYVRLAELVCLEVDHWTVSNPVAAKWAVAALKECEKAKKAVSLSILVEKKIDCDRLCSALDAAGKGLVEKVVKRLILQVGKFEYGPPEDPPELVPIEQN